MSGQWLNITSIDTWMFRDGTPFDQSDAGAAIASSIFPPYPPTVAGAVRAALWHGPLKGRWDTERLGNGVNWQEEPAQCSPLSFSAPVLLRDGQPLFPAPLNLVKTREGQGEIVRLRPAEKPIKTDLGELRLPQPEGNMSVAPLKEVWLTHAGMQKVLAGKALGEGDWVEGAELFEREERVGIAIDPATRRVEEGALYMAGHVRLKKDVSLAVELRGYEGDELPETLTAMAGEHRMAHFGVMGALELPRLPENLKDGRYIVYLLSPLLLDAMPKPGGGLAGLPGKVVSACTGKAIRIGGWDSRGANGGYKGPLPLRAAIPAGSVFFMEGADGDLAQWHGKHIGKAAEWGFGQILIGKW